MPMSENRDQFEVFLTKDVEYVHAKGLAKDIEAVSVPALAELAEAIGSDKNTEQTGYYRQQIRALLLKAIPRVEETEKRRQGLQKLFDIADETHVAKLGARRDAAAASFDYKDGESLRQGKPGKRGFEEGIREGLVTQLLALAAEHGFEYTVRHGRPQPAGDDEDEADSSDSTSGEAEARKLTPKSNTEEGNLSTLSPRPEAAPIELDDVEQMKADGDDGMAGRPIGPIETPDDAETPETVGSSSGSGSGKPRPRLLAVLAVAVVLLVGVVLLVPGRAGSAHRRASTKTLSMPVSFAPSSPQRPTYDYDRYDPNDNNCADPNNPGRFFGRCGAITGHVLDSFINTPSYGDETHFFDARLGNHATNTNADPLTDVTIGSTVVLRAYVDNDTLLNPNNPAASETHNTRVRVNLHPTTDVEQLLSNKWVLQPEAFVSASDAQTVEDGVNLVGPEPFALEYEAGSARLLRDNITYPLSNGIVDGEGAPIGLLYMNGNLPSGNNFDAAALVELRAHVVSVPPPETKIVDQVRMTGSESWHSPFIYVKPGDDVEWQLNTINGPWSTGRHFTTSDRLPSNLRLDSGTVTLKNARGQDALADGPLFGGGYTTGDYNPGDNTLFTFKTRVLGNFNGCRIIDRNISYASSDQTPAEVVSYADVVITKPGCLK
jgi:hypothetical protein